MKRLLAIPGRYRIAAIALGGAVAVAIGAAATVSAAGQTLNIISWQGYTEPAWVKPFEKENNVKVKIVYVGSDDELFAKVKQGAGTYDVVATNSANAKAFLAQGVTVKVDPKKLTNYKNLFPQLTKWVDAGSGMLTAAPIVWGTIPLMYDRRAFKSAPTSWSAVYNPPADVCGKVIYSEDASTAITSVALYLGYKNVYHLSNAQFAKIKDTLLKNRKCVKAYYSGFGDAANYFASGDAVVGLSIGSLIPKLANKRGADVVEIIPKEGAIGWMDDWTITKKGAKNSDLVYKWINYMQSPAVEASITRFTDYGPVVSTATKLLPAASVKALHLNDPSYLLGLVPQGNPQAPDSWDKRINMWNSIKAGK